MCGSCSKNYGQVRLGCHGCRSKGLIVLWIFGTTAWTLFACYVAISGNLADTRAFQAARLGSSPPIHERLSSREIRKEIDIETVNGPLIESSEESSSHGEVDTSACDVAKRNIMESFKVPQVLTGFTSLTSVCVSSSL